VRSYDKSPAQTQITACSFLLAVNNLCVSCMITIMALSLFMKSYTECFKIKYAVKYLN
jgi:hypothetical protein